MLKQGKSMIERQNLMSRPQIPFPVLLNHSGGGGRRVRSEIEHVKKGGGVFWISSYFQLSYTKLAAN